MRKLPQYSFNEGFYIWFDINSKEEYYSTPLYMYKTDFNDDLSNYKRVIIQEKDFYKKKPSKKNSAPKHPATILYPFAEQFGRLLINLLNADFSNFDKAYNTFFYLYGFELLREYVPDKELIYTYKSEEELTKIMKRVYEDSYGYVSDMQYNFRKCVDFVYNLNGNEELKNSKPSSKFIASLVTHHNDVYSYSSDIEVILDTYSDKYLKYGNQPLNKLTEELDQDDSFIPMTNVCDLPNEDGKSCREKGAKQTYKQNLEKIPALLEYRKAYQKKFMEVARSDNNKQLKKDFDSWKKIAQGKIKDYKQGKVTEDELYTWMIENK